MDWKHDSIFCASRSIFPCPALMSPLWSKSLLFVHSHYIRQGMDAHIICILYWSKVMVFRRGKQGPWSQLLPNTFSSPKKGLHGIDLGIPLCLGPHDKVGKTEQLIWGKFSCLPLNKLLCISVSVYSTVRILSYLNHVTHMVVETDDRWVDAVQIIGTSANLPKLSPCCSLWLI
jgi:hypothetical protein